MNSQSECFISAQHSYATLKFVNDINSNATAEKSLCNWSQISTTEVHILVFQESGPRPHPLPDHFTAESSVRFPASRLVAHHHPGRRPGPVGVLRRSVNTSFISYFQMVFILGNIRYSLCSVQKKFEPKMRHFVVCEHIKSCS